MRTNARWNNKTVWQRCAVVLLSVLVFFGCAAEQKTVMAAEPIRLKQKNPVSSRPTIDMAIDKLVREISSSLAKENRPKIAVVDLLGPNDNHTQLGSLVSQKLITKLFRSGRFEKILERKLLNDLLVQQTTEMQGYFDEGTVRSICGKVGMDAMLTGFITDYGSRVDVNVRLISTEGEVLSVAEASIDKDMGINSMLQRLEKATLTVAINPSDVGASVAVGEKVLRTTNGIAVFRGYPKGNRDIIVTSAAFETVQQGVYLSGDMSITIALVPKRVKLTVTVVPPEAEILVDGEDKGRAPDGVMVLTDVPAGKHAILVKADGYLQETRAVELYEDETVLIKLFPGPIDLKATGEGIYPNDSSMNPYQKKLMAKRAATIDAYRKLLERVNEIQVDSQTKMKDLLLQNDQVTAKVSGFIRGAEVADVRSDQEGIVEVDVVMTLGREFYDALKPHLK